MKLAVSVGCPCGIGPEVSVAAAQRFHDAVDEIALVGDAGAIADAARLRGVDLASLANVRVIEASALAESERRAGQPGVEAGRAQLAAIDRALEMVMRREAEALVTGPVSKHAIASTGIAFTGHTEYLEQKTSSAHSVMCFIGPKLRTALVTNHLPHARVAGALTREAISRVTVTMARALWRNFGVTEPRIAVSALNPHAGEHGLLGDEEERVIAPAIEDATALLQGIATVRGPIGAETAFREARDGRWDAVVAMYHDQATIASKLLDFGEAVNVTLGLSIVRTSVDHGTGYDIAGRGVADPAGMLAAMRLAATMTVQPNARA